MSTVDEKYLAAMEHMLIECARNPDDTEARVFRDQLFQCATPEEKRAIRDRVIEAAFARKPEIAERALTLRGVAERSFRVWFEREDGSKGWRYWLASSEKDAREKHLAENPKDLLVKAEPAKEKE